MERALELLADRFGIDKPSAGGLLQRLVSAESVQPIQKKHTVLIRCINRNGLPRASLYLDPIASLIELYPEDVARQLTLITQRTLRPRFRWYDAVTLL